MTGPNTPLPPPPLTPHCTPAHTAPVQARPRCCSSWQGCVSRHLAAYAWTDPTRRTPAWSSECAAWAWCVWICGPDAYGCACLVGVNMCVYRGMVVKEGAPIIATATTTQDIMSEKSALSPPSTQTHRARVRMYMLVSRWPNTYLCPHMRAQVFQFPERHFLGDTIASELSVAWPPQTSARWELSNRTQQVGNGLQV